jgi:hypothetical protein
MCLFDLMFWSTARTCNLIDAYARTHQKYNLLFLSTQSSLLLRPLDGMAHLVAKCSYLGLLFATLMILWVSLVVVLEIQSAVPSLF